MSELILRFELAGRRFGILLAEVRELLPMAALTPLPVLMRGCGRLTDEGHCRSGGQGSGQGGWARQPGGPRQGKTADAGLGCVRVKSAAAYLFAGPSTWA